MQQVATPGFTALHPEIMAGFIFAAASDLGRTAGSEPSMIVGDPDATSPRVEDEGRTIILPMDGIRKVYAIRDDLPQGPVVTFLLASEY